MSTSLVTQFSQEAQCQPAEKSGAPSESVNHQHSLFTNLASSLLVTTIPCVSPHFINLISLQHPHIIAQIFLAFLTELIPTVHHLFYLYEPLKYSLPTLHHLPTTTLPTLPTGQQTHVTASLLTAQPVQSGHWATGEPIHSKESFCVPCSSPDGNRCLWTARGPDAARCMDLSQHSDKNTPTVLEFLS